MLLGTEVDRVDLGMGHIGLGGAMIGSLSCPGKTLSGHQDASRSAYVRAVRACPAMGKHSFQYVAAELNQANSPIQGAAIPSGRVAGKTSSSYLPDVASGP